MSFVQQGQEPQAGALPGPGPCPGSEAAHPMPAGQSAGSAPGWELTAVWGAPCSLLSWHVPASPVCGLRAHPTGVRAAARAPISYHRAEPGTAQAGLLPAEDREGKHLLHAALEGLAQAETECWPQLQGRGTECCLGRAEMPFRPEATLPRPSCPLCRGLLRDPQLPCSPRRAASPSNTHCSMPVHV